MRSDLTHTVKLKIQEAFIRSHAKTLYRNRWRDTILYWVQLWVTKLCNENCPTCYSRNNDSQDMSLGQIKFVIDKINQEFKCYVIAFYGGEPTLRPDLEEMIAYAKEKDMLTYVSTNGKLLTPGRVNSLGEAGIHIIDYAVDSLAPSYPYKQFNRTVLDNLLEGREKFGFLVRINHCYGKQNVDQTLDLVELAHKEDIPICIRMATEPSIPSEGYESQGQFFTKDDIPTVRELVEELKSKRQSGYNIQVPKEYFDLLEGFLQGNVRWNCHAGRYFINIYNDGSILPCSDLLDPLSINIFQLTQSNFKQLREEVEKKLEICNSRCLCLTPYEFSYYRDKPTNEEFSKDLG